MEQNSIPQLMGNYLIFPPFFSNAFRRYPGSRYSASSFVDATNNEYWVWGGYGVTTNKTQGTQNFLGNFF